MTALEGMRVLDMTLFEAGTSGSQALAWLGADVVKVEPPERGDPGRALGPGPGDSEYFLNWNSNKRSVTIDLNQPAGRELLLDMLPSYDVFIENYAPGVIEKLDLGYEVMKAIHPGVIYARVKGFGTSGPYSGYKSLDTVAQAAAGALSVTGMPDGPPLRPGPTTGDCGTGVQLALAIVAAYVQRLRTGKGQLIELSMQEAMTYYMRTAVSLGSDFGSQAVLRTGNGHGATMNLFPCSPGGSNDYVYLMLVNTRMWLALCEAIERPDLPEDPRFEKGQGRIAHAEELYEAVAQWTRRYTKYEAMKRLAEAGVPCSAVLDTRDLFTDPHLLARDFVKTVEHGVRGPVRLLGWPPRMSASQVEIEAAPLLGQHTAEVLNEDLGLSQAEISELHERGVIGRG